MKTTFDLDEDLLTAARALAAQRHTTLKDVITHALRREIGTASNGHADEGDRLVVGPFNILRLKPRGVPVTDAMVRGLLDAADDEDFERAVRTSGKR